MVKIGLYLPVYGGWFRPPVKEEEEPPTYAYMKQIAIEAEKIGLDSLWIPDHMLNPMKGDKAPALEAWTLATAITEATHRVIVTHTVLCEAFRYPAVLAKQTATLHEISQGRFWLSLGAGWYKREYEAYGLPFYEHDERVDRTREAIQIIKGLWKEDSVTFKGKYYSINNGALEPKPKPMPPLWYGGVSEASRELVAEEFDVWLMRRCRPEEAQENIADMKKRLAKKGRSQMEYAIPAFAFIRGTDEEAKRHVEQITEGSDGQRKLIIDSGFAGSPETIAQTIRQLESMGINHVLLQLSPTLAELPRVKQVLALL
ncbi:LLM class flavin-dependent oxidoreductase [Chloroflexota bacterium]